MPVSGPSDSPNSNSAEDSGSESTSTQSPPAQSQQAESIDHEPIGVLGERQSEVNLTSLISRLSGNASADVLLPASEVGI